MEIQRTRYRGYDVLKEKEEWDQHTREIVLKRLGPFNKPQFLTDNEVKLIRVIAGHLVYENRHDILDFVIDHLDQKLSSNIGESQRAPDAPPAKDLIRLGLRAIDKSANVQFGAAFLELSTEQQYEIIAALQKAKSPLISDWSKIPQKELFKKLASEIASAYFSHPVIWSEIGYGGPAYPRGYVRVEFGLTDPWEARSDEGK